VNGSSDIFGRFEVIEGDIGTIARTRGPWLAVVSSDDSYLSHGGGSSRSVWKAARLEQHEDRLDERLPASLGSIFETGAGGLPAQSIWHAITIDYDSRRRLTPDASIALFEEIAGSAMARAAEVDTEARRIVLPMVGAGAGGLAENVILDRIASLVVRLDSAGIGCTLAVVEGSERIRSGVAERVLGDPEIALDRWLPDLPEDGTSRIFELTGATEWLLRRWITTFDPVGDKDISASRMWECAERDVRGTAQAAALPKVRTACLRALDHRNRLTHGTLAPDPLSVQECEAAFRLLAGFLLRLGRWSEEQLLEAIGRGSERRRRYQVGPRSIDVRAFPATPVRPKAERAAMLSLRSHPHRAEHVERLVTLLLELPKDDLEDLKDLLEHSGFRGELELRVREYCTREDPRAVLGRLSSARLKAILRDRYQEDVLPNSSLEERRDRVLHRLGFSVPRPLRGLGSALEELHRHRSELASGDPRKRDGAVIAGAKVLERSVQDLLRFVCLHLFGHGPEHHFKGHVSGAATNDFSKASLGTLLHALERLARELESMSRDAGPQEAHPFRELKGPLTARRLAPDGVDQIARLRNVFAHADSREGGPKVSAKDASDFFDLSIRLLNHWRADDSVYPTVIRIERITIDAWNRRVIEAVTPEETKEFIVSDRPIEPGATYFMYPLSNPMRVEPVLIEFGAEGE
jgi:O-acetyl-ADP-ribose deacetylase (regulator of RNase III)